MPTIKKARSAGFVPEADGFVPYKALPMLAMQWQPLYRQRIPIHIVAEAAAAAATVAAALHSRVQQAYHASTWTNTQL